MTDVYDDLTAKDRWDLIDFRKVDPSVAASLTTKQRQELYQQLTQTFTTHSDTKGAEYKVDGIEIETQLTHSSPISLSSEWFIMIAYSLLFVAPMIFVLITIYFICNPNLYTWLIYIIIYLILILHPLPTNSELFVQNRLFFDMLHYFSYKHVIHRECYEYIRNHNDIQKRCNVFKTININSKTTEIKCNQSLIFNSIPHAILPLASGISPVITRDIFKTYINPTGADIVFYMPFMRQIAVLYGVISASKASIINTLKQHKHVNIVSDGIKGMFVKHDNNETVLLRHRKGVSKLALQTGSHVVPCYGFGNSRCYSGLFDSYGVMKWLSSKLRMSIIIPYGRWFSALPNKVPLYNVIGKPIYNQYCNEPLSNPTQTQINEYHEMILDATKQLFEQHKSIYGWSHKQLVFV